MNRLKAAGDDEEARVSKADTVRAPNVQSRDRAERDGVPETMGGGRFNMEKKLGEGSFGMVYSGYDTKRQQMVAIKVEHKRSSAAGQLANESRLMDLLSRPVQRPGFAELFHFSKEGAFAILVMDLLGMSLEDSCQICDGVLNAASCGLIAEQAIHHLAYLHSKGIVHRDIKSENFMWGSGSKCHHLYLIDFGMSSRYYIKKHVRFGTGKHLTGTARYASINAMKGYVQSRRDDLEAVGYLLMYSLRGALPWSGLSAPNWNDKLRAICEKKETFPMAELCKGYPEEFERYLRYTRRLEFEQKPDYEALMQLFRGLRKSQEPVTRDWDLQWLAGKNIDTNSLVTLITDQACPLQPEATMSAEVNDSTPGTSHMSASGSQRGGDRPGSSRTSSRREGR